MERTKIELPERVHFTCQLQVRGIDLNSGGHLAHDSLVTFLHEARNQLLGSMGYHELNVAGAGIVLAELIVLYKSEAFKSDQLSIDCFIDNFGSKSFDIFYKVTNQTQQEIARAKTGIVFFDYENRRGISVPYEFKQQFLN